MKNEGNIEKLKKKQIEGAEEEERKK